MKTSSAVTIPALCGALAAAFLPFCPAQNSTEPKGSTHAAAQISLSGIANAAKEKAAEEALTKVLNDNLPLTLNAKDVYPTVTTLPGGTFSPQPLQLTADQLNQPLAPGDYTINTLDFCSEYSVHQPGAGLAYVLGPYEGKAAGAIGALIWRGTEQYGIAPQSLQAVSWAIQSGLTYSQMPKSYQAIIDQVIPDLKNQITGDLVTNLENTYNSLAQSAKLPPLDTILAKLGTPGQLALDAERERQILTAQNTSDELKQQTLFQGQESGIYTPVKAENGPWTERVKGQVYMKLLIAGGNMNSNNVMQIRVMPPPATTARNSPRGPHLVRTAYGEGQLPEVIALVPTLYNLLEGILGYSQGQGAQALGQVAAVQKGAPSQPPPAQASTPSAVGAVSRLEGTATVIRAGTTTPVPLNQGDALHMGDKILTGPQSRAEVTFVDKTQLTLGEKATFVVADYEFDPSGKSKSQATYGILEGAFQYVSGLLAQQKDHDVNIDTPYGNIGIRGTELICKSDGTASNLEIDLISGAIALTANGSTTAGSTMSAPVQIEVTPQGVQTLPLTQDQYNSLMTQYLLAVPTS